MNSPDCQHSDFLAKRGNLSNGATLKLGTLFKCDSAYGSPMRAALFVLSLFVFIASHPAPGFAAEIRAEETQIDGLEGLRGGLRSSCRYTLTGPIERGDVDRVRALDHGRYDLFCLNSRGGSYAEALKIAEYFIDQGVGTVVRGGDACLSACAIIFLSGAITGEGVTYRNRFMHILSTVGFHTPFLELPDREYSKEAIENAHRSGLLSLAKLLALEPNNSAHDHEFFPKELVAEMANRRPSESFLIDTIKKAIKFKVELFGVPELQLFNKAMACNACSNLNPSYPFSECREYRIFGKVRVKKESENKCIYSTGLAGIEEPGYMTCRIKAPCENIDEWPRYRNEGRHSIEYNITVVDGTEVARGTLKEWYVYPHDLKISRTTKYKFPKQSFEIFRIVENADLSTGKDLSYLRKVGQSKCENACKDEKRCEGFTYDKWNRWCFLKTSIGVGKLRREPKAVSGVRRNIEAVWFFGPTKVVRLLNKSFPDDPTWSSVETSYESCKAYCMQKHDCVAFTFYDESKQCHLMSEVGEYVTDRSADSGFKRQLAK